MTTKIRRYGYWGSYHSVCLAQGLGLAIDNIMKIPIPKLQLPSLLYNLHFKKVYFPLNLTLCFHPTQSTNGSFLPCCFLASITLDVSSFSAVSLLPGPYHSLLNSLTPKVTSCHWNFFLNLELK